VIFRAKNNKNKRDRPLQATHKPTAKKKKKKQLQEIKNKLKKINKQNYLNHTKEKKKKKKILESKTISIKI